MEAGEGNVEEARGIFTRGAQGSPHAPLLIAWADLEQESGRHALSSIPHGNPYLCAPHVHAYGNFC